MAKRKIGLALSGGASKGIAHIYVLEQLSMNNIPIHCVTGASAGAIVGGMFASGLFSTSAMKSIMIDEIMPLVKEQWRYLNWSGLFTKNKGLFKIDKIYGLFDSLFDDATFEECVYPFAISTTNMQTGETEYITEGSLAKAITYSMTFPFMFTSLDGVHYDGGILENVPVRGCKQLGANKIIAVDLKQDFTKDTSYLHSHFKLLSRLKDVILHGGANDDRADADVIFAPKMEDFSFFDFDKLKQAEHAVATCMDEEVMVTLRKWQSKKK